MTDYHTTTERFHFDAGRYNVKIWYQWDMWEKRYVVNQYEIENATAEEEHDILSEFDNGNIARWFEFLEEKIEDMYK